MTQLLVTFSRFVDEPFERSVGALRGWRPEGLRRVDLDRADLDAPADGAPDRYRVTLRLVGRARSVPMELRVTPWSSTSGTHIELLPLRSVRPSHRYFRRGRSVLSDVVSAIDGASAGGEPRGNPDAPSAWLRRSA
jgi:hypothetical protein